MNDWEIRWSKSRSLPYYYNRSTLSSLWEPPSTLSATQVAQLPGASFLTAPPPPPPSSTMPTKVRASHLLIKHRDSRRPSSWKEDKIGRTKEEALEILARWGEELNKAEKEGVLAETFDRIARTESDCSSARNGGDLGPFGPGQMQKPFEDAAFSTPVGGLSGVVDTESGVHLILRTA